MDDYQKIAASEEYRQFKKAKVWFLWPIVLLFVCYYLALPLMAGYAKGLMGHFVFSNITFGYLFGISYYLVAWALAFVYVVKARKFDQKAKEIVSKHTKYTSKGA
ncbi:DUF485 domain-containing protein [Brevibacillus ruminantium]|uniref:DUF485 domain-containing protein n=1 Tax=Brevibacillus ruminantium TaxID=2950604 RepID=A0ABY4W7Z9_9BACL|nr:DUF485 domain-containing protein [Brevibacillus ruminantium]USG63305.1 DUF485 domain-containing protein [Brevibacillus ruminantium]